MADILYIDESALVAYRITAKRLSVGDGIAVDAEQDEISRRDDVTGRLLLTLNNLPLVKYGTAIAETAVLKAMPQYDASGNPELPDDLVWESIDVTESSFLALDEYVSWLWVSAVLDKNPHRNPGYSALKKALSRAMLSQNSSVPTSASGTPDKSAEKN